MAETDASSARSTTDLIENILFGWIWREVDVERGEGEGEDDDARAREKASGGEEERRGR